jgi:hypothetical protein
VCLHAAVLLVSALAMPSLGADLRADIEPVEHLHTLLATLSAAEPELQVHPAVHIAERDPDGEEPANSRCGESRGGTMGEPSAKVADAHYGVQGPRDNPDPHLARHWGPDSGFFDGVGLDTRPWLGGDPGSPLAPWGRDDSLGNDPRSVRGATWGEELGAAFGSPGIGTGLATLCETCGHSGFGAALSLRTVPGPATPTEPSLWAGQPHLPEPR